MARIILGDDAQAPPPSPAPSPAREAAPAALPPAPALPPLTLTSVLLVGAHYPPTAPVIACDWLPFAVRSESDALTILRRIAIFGHATGRYPDSRPWYATRARIH